MTTDIICRSSVLSSDAELQVPIGHATTPLWDGVNFNITFGNGDRIGGKVLELLNRAATIELEGGAKWKLRAIRYAEALDTWKVTCRG